MTGTRAALVAALDSAEEEFVASGRVDRISALASETIADAVLRLEPRLLLAVDPLPDEVLRRALHAADAILDRPNADPDDDPAIVARSLFRVVSRGMPPLRALADLEADRVELEGLRGTLAVVLEERDKLRMVIRNAIDNIAHNRYGHAIRQLRAGRALFEEED